MNQDAYIPFAKIPSELTKNCIERKTGPLYSTSDANRSAQIMVDQGRIVYLYYFNKRGSDALRLISEIDTGRYRFQEGTAPSMRTDIPDTEEILNSLSSVCGDHDSQVIDASRRIDEAEESGPRSIITLTVTQKRILEEGLAVHIGPMAAIICEEHLVSTSDVKVAIELLAGEILAEAQAESFRAEMRRKLVD
jgi:hypothetical protein